MINSAYYSKGGLTPEDKNDIYKKWRKLINMSRTELIRFYNSEEGKVAGLTPSEAGAMGIQNGRKSARWIIKMKHTPKSEWTDAMWQWAKRQINFVTRMSGNKGKLYDDKGRKTRKHTSLLIWGHNPEKAEDGMATKYAGGGKTMANYETYHETLASVLREIEWYVEYLGYRLIDPDYSWVTHGGIPYGTTKKLSLEVSKYIEPTSGYVTYRRTPLNKMLHASIYRMDSGRYELTCYVFEGGGSTDNKTQSMRLRRVEFRSKRNPRLNIMVETYPNGQIVNIENNANIYFPYNVGQVLNRGHETWACVNNYTVNGKDTCPEKKIMGIRERDIPPGHPLRYMK